MIVVLLVVLIIIIMLIVNGSKAGSRSSSPRRQPAAPKAYEDTPLPEQLGLQPHVPLGPAVLRLEEAIGGDFGDKLQARVLSQYPAMTEAEYRWKLLELKRYFLMTAILREVPMFSERVDDLWHEMLMFTREYQQFGDKLLGEPIHHAPHAGGSPDPDGRAWFDWIYAHLFVPTPYSGRIWNAFFRHPLDRSLIEELRYTDEATLRSRRFNDSAARKYPEIAETVSLLIAQAKDQAIGAGTREQYEAEKPGFQTPAYMPYLAGAMMFYSVSELADYGTLMEEHYAEEEARRRMAEASGTSGSSSSACGSGCGSSVWTDDSSGNGTDGGGYSCSSSDGGTSNCSSTDGGSSSCSSSDGGSSSCSSSSCSSSSCGGGGGD